MYNNLFETKCYDKNIGAHSIRNNTHNYPVMVLRFVSNNIVSNQQFQYFVNCSIREKS